MTVMTLLPSLEEILSPPKLVLLDLLPSTKEVVLGRLLLLMLPVTSTASSIESGLSSVRTRSGNIRQVRNAINVCLAACCQLRLRRRLPSLLRSLAANLERRTNRSSGLPDREDGRHFQAELAEPEWASCSNTGLTAASKVEPWPLFCLLLPPSPDLSSCSETLLVLHFALFVRVLKKKNGAKATRNLKTKSAQK